jgi:hypothetical protein
MNLRVIAMLWVLLTGVVVTAQDATAPSGFFPFKAGAYWVYEGTVSWFDTEKEDAVTEKVSWRMTVDKVIRKEGVVAAIVTGFPEDLDWSTGSAEPRPWLFLEDSKHQVHYIDMGPNFDLSKYEKGDASFDKFLVDDTLLFQWPLKKGAKFCDEEGKNRDDMMYCWFVSDAKKKKLETVNGAPAREVEVFELRYVSNPDDTTMEFVPNIGMISYRYHHHGTVADTELQLVEFHPADDVEKQGAKP